MVPAVADVTVPVKVMLAPAADGFSDDMTTVVVEALVAAFTVSENAGDVLDANFVSPLYFAVMECVPCVNVVVETAALPALIVPGAPICVAPSKNVSVPASVPAVVEVTVAVNITLCPTVAGFSDETTVVVVGAVAVPALTTCDSAGEVLSAWLESPKYFAVMECVPWVRVVVEKDALPPLNTNGLVISLAPSKNSTSPTIAPGVGEVTFAVNVTFWPTVEGLSDELTAVMVTASTVCRIPDDVDGANVVSPLYMQKIEWFPWPSVDVVNVAFPAFTATGAPSGAALSRKVTVPVGVPGVAEVMLAVNVTACPTVEGFRLDEIDARVVDPAEAVEVPATENANGLPGALVVTKTVPLVRNPVFVSFVGANVTLMVHDTPGPIEDGQLLVAEKFSEARTPTKEKAMSPTLLKFTGCGALTVLMG
jgi:hypothetical protein